MNCYFPFCNIGAKSRMPFVNKVVKQQHHLSPNHLQISYRSQAIFELRRQSECNLYFSGLAYSSPAANCKVMKEQFPHAKSGSYWLDLDGGGHDNAFLGYCDMETGGGGWTLVYSYTFTLRPLASTAGDNQAVTPRPNWPINVGANTHTPVSTTPPTSETDYAAMEFNLWKTIGQEILIKSNLNHWISCTPATGNLLTWATGTMNCGVVKNVSSQCPGSAPSWFGTFQCGPSFQKGNIQLYECWFTLCLTNTNVKIWVK